MLFRSSKLSQAEKRKLYGLPAYDIDKSLLNQSKNNFLQLQRSGEDYIHPFIRNTDWRNFGDEMRGVMRQWGLEPTNQNDVEKFRKIWIDDQYKQLFNSKPMGFGEKATYVNNPLRFNKNGGIIEDNRGQWNHPGDVTRIRSKNITMHRVPYPVFAKPNKGKGTMMYPGENYFFPEADYVDEYPMMQKGELLPKAQNGFIGPFEEEDGETEFMRSWMSSPKYKEMLTKSTTSPEEYKTIYNKRLDNINRPYLKSEIKKDDVLNQGNIASANILYSSAQYPSPFVPGSKYIPSEKIGYNIKYNPEIFSSMSPLDKMSILVHERSHSTEDRKSTRLNSSHVSESRMPSSA